MAVRAFWFALLLSLVPAISRPEELACQRWSRSGIHHLVNGQWVARLHAGDRPYAHSLTYTCLRWGTR